MTASPLFTNELRFVGTVPTPIGIVTGSDPIGQYTVAGGPNVSHTLWTVSCQCPSDVSAGVAYANMQALLMSAYGYNLLGASYGSGTLSLQIDDLGGLNPSDPTSPGSMIGAVADALAAAGVTNATNLYATSNNTAGWSFPVASLPSASMTTYTGQNPVYPAGGGPPQSPIGYDLSILAKDLTGQGAVSAVPTDLGQLLRDTPLVGSLVSGLKDAVIGLIAIVAVGAIIFIVLTRR